GSACCARSCDHLHLSDSGVAICEFHPAGRDHGVAAVLADRRFPRAPVDRNDAQYLLDHRLHHADGPGDKKRDPARRFREPLATRGRRARGLVARRRAGASAADLDDDCGDDRRHVAARVGLGRRRRATGPMGRAIIGGVITSTLLTLVVVPVIYTYLDQWNERRKARRALRVVSTAAPAKLAADD